MLANEMIGYCQEIDHCFRCGHTWTYNGCNPLVGRKCTKCEAEKTAKKNYERLLQMWPDGDT